MSLSRSSKTRSLNKFFAAAGALLLPFAAHAQAAVLKLEDVGDKSGFGKSQTDPRKIAGTIINSALGIVGLALLAFMIYAGITWMTAGGNSDKVEEAKTTIKNCVIGLAIIVLAFAISQFVIGALTGVPQK